MFRKIGLWFKRVWYKLVVWLRKSFGTDIDIPKYDIDAQSNDIELLNQALDMKKEMVEATVNYALREYADKDPELSKEADQMLREIQSLTHSDTDIPSKDLIISDNFPVIDTDSIYISLIEYHGDYVRVVLEDSDQDKSPKYARSVSILLADPRIKVTNTKFIAEQLNVTTATVRNKLESGKLYGFKKTNKPQARWHILWTS
jgi:hypothetical protein